MKRDLRTELADRLCGRVCLVGIGNRNLQDDAFGVALAQALAPKVASLEKVDVVQAGTVPEEYMGKLMGTYDSVLFLDAVQFGAAPGTVVLLDTAELEVRFPQVSTHKVALGTLARLLEAEGARVALVGVQPEGLEADKPLSPAVQATFALLEKLLLEVLENRQAVCKG